MSTFDIWPCVRSSATRRHQCHDIKIDLHLITVPIVIKKKNNISVYLCAEMALEDTWFFVILASCLMLTLGALLSGLVYLRLNG